VRKLIDKSQLKPVVYPVEEGICETFSRIPTEIGSDKIAGGKSI
jgi:hypothetical protein